MFFIRECWWCHLSDEAWCVCVWWRGVHLDKGPQWAPSLRYSGLWRAAGCCGAQPHSTYQQDKVSYTLPSSGTCELLVTTWEVMCRICLPFQVVKQLCNSNCRHPEAIKKSLAFWLAANVMQGMQRYNDRGKRWGCQEDQLFPHRYYKIMSTWLKLQCINIPSTKKWTSMVPTVSKNASKHITSRELRASENFCLKV